MDSPCSLGPCARFPGKLNAHKGLHYKFRDPTSLSNAESQRLENAVLGTDKLLQDRVVRHEIGGAGQEPVERGEQARGFDVLQRVGAPPGPPDAESTRP